MNKPSFERKFILLAVGAFAIFSVGAITTTIVPPLLDDTLHSAGEHTVHEYTEQEIRGSRIYQREGCVYCHTQQIRYSGTERLSTKDSQRYGWRLVDAPESEAWEYVNDKPHFLGTKRTGPDLARVGGKYSSEWHRAHFINPRDLGEKFVKVNRPNPQKGSIMPSFKYLDREDADGNNELDDLIAYLQTLGRNKDWRELDGKKLNDYEE